MCSARHIQPGVVFAVRGFKTHIVGDAFFAESTSGNTESVMLHETSDRSTAPEI